MNTRKTSKEKKIQQSDKNHKTRDPHLYREVKKDKKGVMLFKVIDKGDHKLLEKLIQHEADISVMKDDDNCLQYAATKGQWECVRLLLDYSGKYFTCPGDEDYICRAGKALLLAAEGNEITITRKLFELVKLTAYGDRREIDNYILFSNINIFWSQLWQDDQNGYTALHWAVKNNNKAMCGLFVLFAKTGAGMRFYGGDSTIYRSKNKKGQIPFELALTLKDLDSALECSREIAKGMSYEYMLHHARNETLCTALLEDIRFGYHDSGHSDNNPFPPIIRELFGTKADEKKKMFYEYFLTLSPEKKSHAFDLILTHGTFLNLLFNYEYKNVSDKYKDLIAKHVENEKNLIASSDESAALMSTSEMQKALNSCSSNSSGPERVSLKIRENEKEDGQLKNLLYTGLSVSESFYHQAESEQDDVSPASQPFH